MKKILLPLLLLILAFGCKPRVELEIAQEKRAESTVKKDALMVQGTSKITITPDRADLTFGLFQETKQLKDAIAKTKEIMNNVLTYAAKAGIPESDIKVQNISMNKYTKNIYKYNDKGKRVLDKEETYYRVDQSFTLTLTDISQYGKVFNDILDLGVNKITNIYFYSTQMDKAKDEAMIKAIQNAKNKANIIAETSGLRIKKLINVVEFEGDRSRYVAPPTITRRAENGYSADYDAFEMPATPSYSISAPRAAYSTARAVSSSYSDYDDSPSSRVETIVPITPAGVIDVYSSATLIYELE